MPSTVLGTLPTFFIQSSQKPCEDGTIAPLDHWETEGKEG